MLKTEDELMTSEELDRLLRWAPWQQHLVDLSSDCFLTHCGVVFGPATIQHIGVSSSPRGIPGPLRVRVFDDSRRCLRLVHSVIVVPGVYHNLACDIRIRTNEVAVASGYSSEESIVVIHYNVD